MLVSTAADKLIAQINGLRGAQCPQCRETVCGHQALFNIQLGRHDRPRCLPCLAQQLGKSSHELAHQLTEHGFRKACIVEAWRYIAASPQSFPDAASCCEWSRLQPATTVTETEANAASEDQNRPKHQDSTWDAGEMACGDLLLALRLRVRAMPAGSVLKLLARDTSAPQDIPVWCKMTGHRLQSYVHPEYFIQIKET